MDAEFQQKIIVIKEWLGTGSVNIFGFPMSGKDTVGVRLATDIGGKFLSSGLIIRGMESKNRQHLTDGGELIDSNLFYDWVLPYFASEELKNVPLVLSSIGRWKGEEGAVISRAKEAGHEIKAAVVLNVSEADVTKRWETVMFGQELSDRGERADDKDKIVFEKRLEEFRKKTLPVLLVYREMGLLVEVKADMDRELVYRELVNRLYEFATAQKK